MSEISSIDEAIARTREIAKRNREQWKNCPADRRDIEHQTCEQCAEEHEQLAEWLEDYKQIKMLVSIEQELKAEYNKGYADGSLSVTEEIIGKAIDDFVKKIKENISESIIYGMLVDSRKYNGFNDTSDKIVDYVVETSKEIAEQLKAGESE